MTVYAFDVNETLLDLSALDGAFEAHLGDRALRPAWFVQMLQLTFVGTITGEYVDYPTAQHAALEMVAAASGRALPAEAVEAIVGGMRSLPAHSDVAAGLARLRADGHRLFALTNTPRDAARAVLAGAGIAESFEAVVSADDVRALKPAAAAYRHLADVAGVPIGDVVLVAAHSWDVSGALAAGARGILVTRGSVVPSPLGRAPERQVADVSELAGLAPATA